jgi:hypothetical protein
MNQEKDFLDFRARLQQLARFFNYDNLFPDLQLDYFFALEKYSREEVFWAIEESKKTEDFFPRPVVFITAITNRRRYDPPKIKVDCEICNGRGWIYDDYDDPKSRVNGCRICNPTNYKPRPID